MAQNSLLVFIFTPSLKAHILRRKS